MTSGAAPAMTAFDALPHAAQLSVLGELAAAATGAYALPEVTAPVLVNLSENATYRIDAAADGRCWALRVHRDGYHSAAAIASELAWLQALRNDGVVVTPRPVSGRDGMLIQTIGHPALARPRHVVLFEWESGSEPSEKDRLNEKFATLGEVTARMHRHAQEWSRPPGFERLTWDFETSLGATPHWGSWRSCMGLDPAKETLFGDAVALIGRRLERFGKAPERFGLIHCDMRLANLLVDGDAVKVLDFDDCGFSWNLYDAATTVSFFEHEPQVPELLDAWVTGYRRIRELPAEEEAEIPTFVMLRRMLLVAWIGSHAETDLAQSMGVAYSESTCALCEDYLSRFG